MMDKTRRNDMLTKLDAGNGYTVADAMMEFGQSERNIRRLLSAYRKNKAGVPADSGVSKSLPEGSTPSPAANINPGPVPKVSGGNGTPVAPSMAEIDATLNKQNGTAAAQPGTVPELTADMALFGARFLKQLGVVTVADFMSVKDDKKVLKLAELNPMVETIIRMQKPESFAKLGEWGSHPMAVPIALLADLVGTAILLWKLRPKDEEEEAGK